ncbi:unnamed protein product [Acanthoscelides obtectus]|uniref:Uncharacterized protein n=1 Tax=Acanthoscelides obtectus TaxID=200917 RepID=A0A9P0PAR4_ACAOB|nr:unnamed protein product [Acanthoscelides obtectus]CAK1640173.1 hypothetical protein AOBTE_LOCUS11574 [Acanthoscelides obtectus]
MRMGFHYKKKEYKFLSSKSGSGQFTAGTLKNPNAKEESLIQLQKNCLRKQIEAAEAQISCARAEQSSAAAEERAAISLVKFAEAGEQSVNHIIERDMLQ